MECSEFYNLDIKQPKVNLEENVFQAHFNFKLQGPAR